MNYKVGDLVKITGNCNGHEFNIGETAKLKRKADGLNPTWIAEYLDGHDYWYVRECDMKPVKPAIMPQKIIITTDGKTTLARLFDGKAMVKRAEAKCAPSDVFDFGVGAELAVRRLMGAKPVTKPAESEPVKLYCIESYRPGEWLTKGKIYELDVDGTIHYDDGYSKCFYDVRKNSSARRNLVPLVRRPAKAGEWVLIVAVRNPSEHTGYVHNGEIRLIDEAAEGVRTTHAAAKKEQRGSWLWEDEYLVLDGYTGDPA